MRPDKFTPKMQEALQAAQDIASQFNQRFHFQSASRFPRQNFVTSTPAERRKDEENNLARLPGNLG